MYDIADCSYITFHLLFKFQIFFFNLCCYKYQTLTCLQKCAPEAFFTFPKCSWTLAATKSDCWFFAVFLLFITDPSKTVCFCKMFQFGRWVFHDKSSVSSEKFCLLLFIIWWERDEVDVFQPTNRKTWLTDFPSCQYPLSLNCYYLYHVGSYKICRLQLWILAAIEHVFSKLAPSTCVLNISCVEDQLLSLCY